MLSERLELFRTQTLVPLEPVDKNAQAANDEIDQIIDSTMALGADAITVVDLPIENSKAGLYIHLSSLVSESFLLDDFC